LEIPAEQREENGYYDDVVTSTGASGLMLLVPEIANWIVEEAGFDFSGEDSLLDPAKNVLMGTWYFKWLIDRYEGKEAFAIVAFYHGEDVADELFASGKWDGNYNTVSRVQDRAVRQHVKDVYASYNTYVKWYANK